MQCLTAGILVADHLCSPISHLPAAGELVMAESLPLSIGGCAANVAVDLARLGVDVGVAGCVGKDPFGDFVLKALKDQKVGTRHVRQCDNASTSGTLIINVNGEDRRFIHAFGANARFTADSLPMDVAAGVDVLYVGGFLLMPSLEPFALAKTFGELRRGGTRTVLDVVIPGAGNWRSQLEPVLRETDVFLPNADEAHAITGLDDPISQGEKFLAAGAGTVVITTGAQGSTLLTRNMRLRAGSFKTPFAGGTGAGDAFDAGFILGMLQGLDERMCLAWGSAIGASCVRAVSATEGVFTRDEAEDFLRHNPIQIEEL